MARKSPVARAGNYAAPVDTSGMDPSMKESLGFGPGSPASNPIQALFSKWFGAKQRVNTAADKSASVRRTSDIPVDQIGQGIQGNRHDVKSGSGMGIK